ncbi:MAG: deoxyguanosinetriphosphate triphosphohydrolase [Peptococcaceae bacterium]|jgi:dGTPase|nr:deoxyguanosinetriphosphate triphosphohydrolase [Peptococcaceae bacterium]MDH7524564.1 deoxyguanosinetriphosphate triphosphohydrolase [Peptococcaceae bacterium]
MSIRQEIEAFEETALSPYAMLASRSVGRQRPEEPDPIRTCFMRDRDRIIHSKSFRRLKHKTQVFIAMGNDHYRTRLTHTLEVNQISQTAGKALRLNLDLIEAIALGHDVGHTPFAHTGEEVLDRLLPGGFKHNLNSVRVLTRIEQGRAGPGLNLSQEVLDGIAHHSGFGRGESACKTLEGQVVRYADKIAYVQHDIDDSIRASVLTLDDIPKEFLDILGYSHSERVGTLVKDLVLTTRSNLARGEIKVSLSPEINRALQGLRRFMFETVYKGPYCQKQRHGAAHIVEYLFSYYMENPDELPGLYREIAEEEGLEQGVADYISGMTDNYCVLLFKDKVLPQASVK